MCRRPAGNPWSRRDLLRSLGVAFLVASGVVLALAAPGGAHEPRTSGGFRFLVGWGEEPAYSGVKNSLEIAVSDANGNPIQDLGESLALEVSKGAEKVRLPLEPSIGAGGTPTPGEYRASLTPTRPGTYVVRLVGTVLGQNVDETFTSSATTFDDVVDAGEIQFPARDPSAGEVGTRIDREVPRLEDRAAALERTLRRTEGRLRTVRVFAIVALGVGALGLAVAAACTLAVRRGRRTTHGARATASAADGSDQAATLSR